jgi:hypothetical protein
VRVDRLDKQVYESKGYRCFSEDGVVVCKKAINEIQEDIVVLWG